MNMNIKDKIKVRAIKQGLTMNQVAEIAGTTRQMLYYYLNEGKMTINMRDQLVTKGLMSIEDAKKITVLK